MTKMAMMMMYVSSGRHPHVCLFYPVCLVRLVMDPAVTSRVLSPTLKVALIALNAPGTRLNEIYFMSAVSRRLCRLFFFIEISN